MGAASKKLRRQVKKKSFNDRVRAIVRRNQESKCFSFTLASSTVAFAGAFYDISQVIQGDGYAERLGSKVTFTRLRFNCIWTSNVNERAITCRVIIFVWHPDNGAEVPAAADVLEDSINIDQIAPVNHMFRKKLTVLADKICTVDYTMGPNQRVMRITKKINVPCTMPDAAQTGINKIYAFLVSSIAVADHYPTIQIMSDLTYYDS